jgi:hypothetical protein
MIDDNIRMNIREIGCEVMVLFHLAKDRDQWRAVANTAMDIRFP